MRFRRRAIPGRRGGGKKLEEHVRKKENHNQDILDEKRLFAIIKKIKENHF